MVEKWWWWKGAMPMLKPPGLGCMSGEAKSASAEEEPPAMAAMDDRTWQSPNISVDSWIDRSTQQQNLIN